MRLTIVLFSVIILVTACGQGSQQPAAEEPDSSLKKGVILVDYREKQKVDVYIDGDIFTSYIYPSGFEKPVLYPLRAASGTIVTRGYPLDPREGERVDHPHHVGVWFNYGDVNGFDFWNNSSAIPEERKASYGRVLHRGVKRAESRDAIGLLEIAADWQVPDQDGNWNTVVQENTIFEFSGDEHTRTIDRITQLTAQENDVLFRDNKEGLFAIRVDRAFTYPSENPQIFTDANGIPTEVATANNEGMTGHYLTSRGVEGREAWGKQAEWVSLSGTKGEEDISIAIFDHPGNPGFPSHWHARDYGLFAVNNLGQEVFSDGARQALNFTLTAGESVEFRHRIYITSGFHATEDQLNEQFSNFSQ
jgi:hypothetical protein